MVVTVYRMHVSMKVCPDRFIAIEELRFTGLRALFLLVVSHEKFLSSVHRGYPARSGHQGSVYLSKKVTVMEDGVGRILSYLPLRA